MNNNYIISQEKTVLDAIKQIAGFEYGPLVLFVVDDEERMVGTLTDGDVRRALISGIKIEDVISKVMSRNFNYVRQGDELVSALHKQRTLKMRLVPILDDKGHIVEIVNLEKYRTRLPVDAVLLAGEKGERLRPLTEKTPKPLLKVGNKAIIDHNIDKLIVYGVNHISVTVNYLGEQLEAHFANPRGEVQVNTVREPKFLGTIGSIKFVDKFYNDTVLVMNSDLFTNINYEDFYLHFKKHDADMSVAAVPYSVNVPYGIFDLEGRNVKGVFEKPVYNYLANAGIFLMKRSVIDEIPEGKFFNSSDLIDKLIKNGSRVIRFPIAGYWIDVDSPSEYQKAKDLINHIY